MSKKCINQVVTPSVDETENACSELTPSTCVVVIKKCNKIGNLPGENLDQFIDRLCNKIARMDNIIYNLTKEVNILKGLAPASEQEAFEKPLN